MRNKELLRLIAGFKRFRERYFEDSMVYRHLQGGQSPKTLIVACSDSRVDPAIITSASPGELFTVRNVANLVPPFETGKGGLHGVSSAIEFAVVSLKVENIVVMGHRQCGGIRALMLGQAEKTSFVSQWMGIAKSAKKRVLDKHKGADEETLCRHCEMESIVTSLDNLRTFPFVEEAIRDRGLSIIGAYFDLENGEMHEYDADQKIFKRIEV